jgi:hypothetical protein
MYVAIYILLGSAAFLGGLLASVGARRCQPWARCAFVLIALLGLGYGSLGLLEHYRASWDYPARAALDHYRTLVAGVAIGVFSVLVISGQFKLAMKTR